MIINTVALISNCVPYSENSQICRAFSPDLGNFSIIAKGILKNQSALCRMLEYDLALYKPREEGLYLLKEHREIQDYCQYPSTATWVVADAGIEFINVILISVPEAPQYYALLKSYLEYLKKVPQNAVFILWRFILRVYQMMGIGLELEQCAACMQPLPAFAFDASGQLFCQNCLPSVNAKAFSPMARELLRLLPEIANHLDAFQPTRQEIGEINELLSNHFYTAHKKTLKLKSLSVLNQFYPLAKKAQNR